jgi:hypothetical protein
LFPDSLIRCVSLGVMMTGRRSASRAVLLAAVLVCLGMSPEPARAADPPLIGRWESVVRSTGGIGQVIELRPDGTMTQWTAVLVELTYQVHGPLLLTFYRHPGSGATETQAAGIRFDGDTMIQKDPQAGGETRLTRKRTGGPQDPPIVGVWSTPHETGQTAFLLYTTDGRVVFRLPIRADRGEWSASGDQLTLAAGPSTSATVRYTVQGDRLVLIDGVGKRIVYTRAELLDYP